MRAQAFATPSTGGNLQLRSVDFTGRRTAARPGRPIERERDIIIITIIIITNIITMIIISSSSSSSSIITVIVITAREASKTGGTAAAIVIPVFAKYDEQMGEREQSTN